MTGGGWVGQRLGVLWRCCCWCCLGFGCSCGGNLFAFGEKSQNRQNRTLDLRESQRAGAAINWAQGVMKSEREP